MKIIKKRLPRIDQSVMRFCRHCKRNTLQSVVGKDINGKQRVRNFVVTLGKSEKINKTVYCCSKCGRENKYLAGKD